MAERFDYLFKFIIIGEAATGKSCILNRFLNDTFKKDSTHTIGVEFGSKIVPVGGYMIKLQVWDTAGQERFRAVTKNYYRGAAGTILVYDVTSRETYNKVSSWVSDARTLANPDIAIVLVGNKIDLAAEREVTFMEASRYAQENDLMFLETSAYTGEGVQEVFLKCARTILTKIETGVLDPESANSGIRLGTRKGVSKQSGPTPVEKGDQGCC
jgi:Ras-related protein Rab-4B